MALDSFRNYHVTCRRAENLPAPPPPADRNLHIEYAAYFRERVPEGTLDWQLKRYIIELEI